MYDFYPEWGPARHRDEEQDRPTRRPRYWQPQPAQQQMAMAGAQSRDGGGDRPDDN